MSKRLRYSFSEVPLYLSTQEQRIALHPPVKGSGLALDIIRNKIRIFTPFCYPVFVKIGNRLYDVLLSMD